MTSPALVDVKYILTYHDRTNNSLYWIVQVGNEYKKVIAERVKARLLTAEDRAQNRGQHYAMARSLRNLTYTERRTLGLLHQRTPKQTQPTETPPESPPLDAFDALLAKALQG